MPRIVEPELQHFGGAKAVHDAAPALAPNVMFNMDSFQKIAQFEYR
jgi:hypothetical protein